MKYIIIILLLCSCSHQIQPKAAKSQRPKTDIVVMYVVLGLVVIWCNEEGFYKHVK